MMKFSIIIPIYNVAPYLRECLDSVRKQSFLDWECLCVDDGSSDGSGSILDEYATHDSRFRVIHQQNGGEGAARNTGLAFARGEWIVFLDGDDVLSSDALRRIYDVVEQDVEIIRFEFTTFQDPESPAFESARAEKRRDVDISLRIDMSEFCAYVWQHAYRREAIAGVQFKRYKRGCDRVFFDDVLLNHVSSIRIIDASLYGYRNRPGSAMNSVPSAQVIRDEMDHRLDIMEMIDASGKKVDYAGNGWLQGYFTRHMSVIIGTRGADRREVLSDWRKRLVRLRRCKGLSRYGRFVACSCPLVRLRLWDYLFCYAIPRLREGGSPIMWAKRKLTGHS